MKKITETDADFICDVSAPCFLALSEHEKELVRFSKTQVQYRKGDLLTKQGTFASYVLFVIEGLVMQYIENDSNKSHNLRIIKPGEFIGLSSVFHNKTFDYSCSAIDKAQVVLIDKAAITQLISKNGLFGMGLMNRYMEQNANLYDNLRSVLYKQSHGRMAEVLLYLAGFEKDYPMIFSLLTRKDIADFANTSMESAVKLLKSYEKEGLVELNRKDVIILNHKGLEELSARG